MRVGVLGSGIVGETLANGFLKHGYRVMRGSQSPNKLTEWKATAGENSRIGTFEATAQFGDILVLAVKGTAASEVLKQAGIQNFEGKTILDATNPIADLPPFQGVLQFFTDMNSSLMESLQKLAPKAHFVKAFSCVGNALMVNPLFAGGPPTMFICGNDTNAKLKTTEILKQFGWETEDMGTAEAARAIEPLCILWCLPGFTKSQWNHAFKLLKK